MPMGIGTFLPEDAIFKRKYRFTLQFDPGRANGGGAAGAIPPICATVANRPQLQIEKTEVFYQNERGAISAKGLWEPLQVTFHDFHQVGGTGSAKLIQQWVRSAFWYDKPSQSGGMGDPGHTYKRTGGLVMYDGMGNALEEWQLFGAWIENWNPGDLDMSSTDNATFECTISYDHATVEYFNGQSTPGGPNSGGPQNTL